MVDKYSRTHQECLSLSVSTSHNMNLEGRSGAEATQAKVTYYTLKVIGSPSVPL